MDWSIACVLFGEENEKYFVNIVVIANDDITGCVVVRIVSLDVVLVFDYLRWTLEHLNFKCHP